jgi:hypothetical protein
MRVEAALAAGLALIAAAVLLTLLHVPLTAAHTDLGAKHNLVKTVKPAAACQAEESLPAGTTAIRLSLASALGPRVAVKVFSGTRILTQGAVPAGWSSGSVTVPVKPLAQTVTPVKVCFALASINGVVSMQGFSTSRAVAARSEEGVLPGRMAIEYLRPGGASWLSQAESVARRLGLGRAASGTWNALLVLTLAGAFITLSSWLVLKELR